MYTHSMQKANKWNKDDDLDCEIVLEGNKSICEETGGEKMGS